MSPKRQTKFLYYNSKKHTDLEGRHHTLSDENKTITTRMFPIFSIGGIIAGLCFGQVFLLLFPTFFASYHYNTISHKYKYSQDRLSHFHDKEDRIMADQLFNEVRVLCLIMTHPANHETQAKHVKNTWGQRCHKLIFLSSAEDTKLGTFAVPVPEGRKYLWNKTREAFKYIYKYHLDEYDWFLKADDDTYVIMENLRKMLYSYSAEFPIFLGRKYNRVVKQGFMTGGAGFVLSKESLKRFIEKGLPDATKCNLVITDEDDTEISQCMENLEVLAGDSRDEYQRARMFQFPPRGQLLPELFKLWHYGYSYYKQFSGPGCCSDHAISFHYTSPSQMYFFDYLIYRLRPFGITHSRDILPDKKSLEEIISALSIPRNNSIVYNT